MELSLHKSQTSCRSVSQDDTSTHFNSTFNIEDKSTKHIQIFPVLCILFFLSCYQYKMRLPYIPYCFHLSQLNQNNHPKENAQKKKTRLFEYKTETEYKTESVSIYAEILLCSRWRWVPHSRAGAFEISRFAFIKDVLQSWWLKISQKGCQIRRIEVLLPKDLHQFWTWRRKHIR